MSQYDAIVVGARCAGSTTAMLLARSDAFRDAEAMASTLDDVFAGRTACDAALADYQRARDDAALPMFALTSQFASLEEPAGSKCAEVE